MKPRTIDRGIIKAMNVTVTGMATAMMLQSDFWGFSGPKLAAVTAVSAVVIYRGIEDIQALARKALGYDNSRNRGAEEKGKRNSVQRIPWFQVRYTSADEENRNSRHNAEAV